MKPDSQHEAPTCWSGCVCHFLAGTALGNHLCGKFSLFCLPSLSRCIALWGSKAPPIPTHEGVCKCAEAFPPSQIPPQGAGPYPQILCLFMYLSFALCHSDEIRLPFGRLGSSASVQKVFRRSCSTGRWLSDVFVGREVILSHSSTILKVLHLFVFICITLEDGSKKILLWFMSKRVRPIFFL